MRPFDLIMMALKNLTRRKLRASLTILGVVIGTTSIVVMLSIGIGLNEMFTKQFEEMGSLNTIEIYPGRGEDSDKDPTITVEQMTNILSLSNVRAITPVLQDYRTEKSFDDYEVMASIYAVKPSTMKLFDFEVSRGRMLTPDDELQVVVGSKVWEDMYETSSGDWESPEEEIDLLGEEITGKVRNRQNYEEEPDSFDIEVVGVLKDAGYPKDYSMFINIDYYQTFIKELKAANGYEEEEVDGYEQAWVYVNDMQNVQEVIEQIEAYGVRGRSDLEYIENAKKQMSMIQAVLGGLGSISLLVAAIGITNTMIMAIYERTKEIGVMKVIGANIRDIKKLFLIEAALIGFWGGVFGIAFSYGLSVVVNHFSGMFLPYMDESAKLSVIPLWLVGASLVFSSMIGIISGYLPARRAMKLSALQAIRTQ